MEYPVGIDNLWMRTNREVSDRFLHINSCGFQNTAFKRHITLRSKGRLDYLFLYVIKGGCTADTKDGAVDLKSGDMLIYRPGEPHRYSFYENEDNQAVYIHFTGNAAKELTVFATDKNVIHTENVNDAVKLLNRIVNDYSEESESMMSISWFIQFCEIFKTSGQSVRDRRINDILKYVNENYYENNTLDFYADMCGVSVDRFAHLFKNTVGVSPHKYITDIRIRQAKYLLEYSDLNINEVSSYVGFEDALYFSRLFKKIYGVSPSTLRKNK